MDTEKNHQAGADSTVILGAGTNRGPADPLHYRPHFRSTSVAVSDGVPVSIRSGRKFLAQSNPVASKGKADMQMGIWWLVLGNGEIR